MSSEANIKRGLSENEPLLIFSDASADPKLRAGFGAYLAIAQTELDILDDRTDAGTGILRGRLRIRKFTAIPPTQLEIETVLWALQEVTAQAGSLTGAITLYTDSQSIINLPRRRARLEKTGFTGAASKTLNHAGLYRAFYRMHDRLEFKLVKLKGHGKRADKTRLDRVFAQVDQAARKALREYRAGL